MTQLQNSNQIMIQALQELKNQNDTKFLKLDERFKKQDERMDIISKENRKNKNGSKPRYLILKQWPRNNRNEPIDPSPWENQFGSQFFKMTGRIDNA